MRERVMPEFQIPPEASCYTRTLCSVFQHLCHESSRDQEDQHNLEPTLQLNRYGATIENIKSTLENRIRQVSYHIETLRLLVKFRNCRIKYFAWCQSFPDNLQLVSQTFHPMLHQQHGDHTNVTGTSCDECQRHRQTRSQ